MSREDSAEELEEAWLAGAALALAVALGRRSRGMRGGGSWWFWARRPRSVCTTSKPGGEWGAGQRAMAGR